MGIFKDMRNLQKQAREMVPPEHRGIGGQLRMAKEGMAEASEMLAMVQQNQMKTQQLMTNGRQGSAVITAVRQTGMYVNENPQVEMDLQVTVDGLEPYTATHRQVIAQIAIPQFQPGATVPVRVDPFVPTSLMITS
jgi:hypothetical protein